MYLFTNKETQNSLFSVINPQEKGLSWSNKYLLTIKKHSTHILFKFQQPVYVSANMGQALIILTNRPDELVGLKAYILSGSIQVPAGVYFNTIALTPECTIFLQAQDKDMPETYSRLKAISVQDWTPHLQIDNLYSVGSAELLPHHPPLILDHSSFNLIMVVEGGIQLDLLIHHLELDQGQAFLTYPQQKASIHHLTGKQAKILTFTFACQGLDKQLYNQVQRLFVHDNQLLKEIQEIQTSQVEQSSYFKDKLINFIYNFLIRSLRHEKDRQNTALSSMRSNYENDLFKEMVAYLKENIEERNEVADLVKHFDLSRSTVQNLFLSQANCSPKTFINQIRLQRSKELMKHTSQSITEIAEKLGYGSIQYFSRAFRKEFGVSPSTYAKSINH